MHEIVTKDVVIAKSLPSHCNQLNAQVTAGEASGAVLSMAASSSDGVDAASQQFEGVSDSAVAGESHARSTQSEANSMASGSTGDLEQESGSIYEKPVLTDTNI